MTEHPALSSSAQQTVLAEIRSSEKSNTDKFKRNALMAVGCLALCAALVSSPLAFAIALTFGLVSTGKIGGCCVTQHHLFAIKRDVGKEGFLDKLKSRATSVSKLVLRANGVSNVGRALALGAGVVSLFTAQLAPLSFLAITGIALWTAGSLAAISLSDTDEKIATIYTVAQAAGQSVAATAPAPASEPSAPGTLANVPSPTADFAGAANTNKQPPTDVVSPTKQPVFKP